MSQYYVPPGTTVVLADGTSAKMKPGIHEIPHGLAASWHRHGSGSVKAAWLMTDEDHAHLAEALKAFDPAHEATKAPAGKK